MAGLTKVFGVRLQHGYFADGVCTPLSLSPTVDCQRLMQQYRLQLRTQPGGADLYAADTALLASFNAAAPFDFVISCNDQNLLNYTAFDQSALSSGGTSAFTLADSIFYCDNLGSADATLLPAFTNSAVQVMPPQFLLPLAAPVSSAALQVLDMLGQAVWQDTSPAQDSAAVQINLSGLRQGRYNLQINAQTVLQFYLSQRPAVRQWGALAIYPGGPAQAAGLNHGCPALSSSGQPLDPLYQYSLSPRSTIWRYRVYSATLNLDDWEVTAKPARRAPVQDGSAAAAGAVAAEAAGATAAVTAAQPVTFVRTNPGKDQDYWLFQSDQPLQLAATPAGLEFTLAPQKSSSGVRSGKKIKLPYAIGDALITPDPDNQLAGSSDIYVYL